MKINLFILDNPAYELVPFLLSLKKIEFVFNDILLLQKLKNENNFILISSKIKKAHLITSVKKFKFFNLSSSCYFIPTKW